MQRRSGREFQSLKDRLSRNAQRSGPIVVVLFYWSLLLTGAFGPGLKAAVLAIVAIVDLAHEARVGAHARDDRAAFEDRVGTAAEILGERDLDRNRRDGRDAVVRHGATS